MRELNSREKIILLVTCVVIGLFVLNFVVITPLREKGEEFDLQLSQAEVSIKKNQNILDEGQDFEATYDRLTQNLQQQRTDEEELADLLSVVQTTAADSGVKIENTDSEPVEVVDFYKEFSASIDFESSWETLPQFLYRLQSPPYGFEVREIKIERDLTNADLLKCRMVLTRIYLNPES